MALQGVSRRFLGNLGHPVRLAQVAAQELPDGYRGVLQRGEGQEHARLLRDLDVQYKTAFVLAHKLREAMASSMKALRIGGEGRTAEIDGVASAAISGRRTPPLIGLIAGSPSTSRANAGLSWRCVSAAAACWRRCSRPRRIVAAIRLRIAKGTVIHADESPAWNVLHVGFAMKRINHQDGYRIDDVCTNGTESHFLPAARLNPDTITISPDPISSVMPRRRLGVRTCAASATATVSGGVVGLAMHCKPSVDFAATGNAPAPPRAAAK